MAPRVTRPGHERDPYKASRKEIPLNDQPHGRYYAQELVLDENVDARRRGQDALDAGENRKWHLVGVSNVPQERGVVLFWDTVRPSFGRSS